MQLKSVLLGKKRTEWYLNDSFALDGCEHIHLGLLLCEHHLAGCEGWDDGPKASGWRGRQCEASICASYVAQLILQHLHTWTSHVAHIQYSSIEITNGYGAQCLIRPVATAETSSCCISRLHDCDMHSLYYNE